MLNPPQSEGDCAAAQGSIQQHKGMWKAQGQKSSVSQRSKRRRAGLKMCEKKQENLTLGDIYRNISKEAPGSMKW